jgi:hypothetical protein
MIFRREYELELEALKEHHRFLIGEYLEEVQSCANLSHDDWKIDMENRQMRVLMLQEINQLDKLVLGMYRILNDVE